MGRAFREEDPEQDLRLGLRVAVDPRRTELVHVRPTEKQRQRIQKTRDTIDAALVNDNRIFLNTQKQISFLTGSYSRKTILRPIDDIDLYVRVHYGKHAEGQSPHVGITADGIGNSKKISSKYQSQY